MSDAPRITGERVFCHECSHEWDRRHGGLECPQCHSEFTEILSNAPSLVSSPDTSPDSTTHPLREHNPWGDEQEYPDPDEGDINTIRFNTRLGNGTISFMSRTYRSDGNRSAFGNRTGDPTADIGRDFNSMLENIMGVRSRNRSSGVEPFPPMGGIGLFPVPPQGGRRNGGRMDDPDFAQTPFGPMFSAIFSTMNNMQPRGPGIYRAGGQELPPHPILLLQQLMNPGGAHGDAVFSQEALDRVISQLMEQNATSNAPPPAPEAAIEALPKKTVDASMLGADGKAECSICMDNVDKGEEVTSLPCNHWFHGQCVTSWLKEHDTCPICRSSITKPPGQPEPNQPSSSSRFGSPRRSSRRHSSSAGIPSLIGGSRNMPGGIPDSPPSERRGDSYYDGSRRPNTSRRGESSRSGSSSSRSGITGWIQRQLGGS